MPYSITRTQWDKSPSQFNHCMSHQDVQPFIISVMTFSSCQIQTHRNDIWQWKCLDSSCSSSLITRSAMRNGWHDLWRSAALLKVGIKHITLAWGPTCYLNYYYYLSSIVVVVVAAAAAAAVVVFIPNRVQRYNTVCMTDITNSGVIIDVGRIQLSVSTLDCSAVFYPRPVMAFGYCHRLRLSVCVCVRQLSLSER